MTKLMENINITQIDRWELVATVKKPEFKGMPAKRFYIDIFEKGDDKPQSVEVDQEQYIEFVKQFFN